MHGLRESRCSKHRSERDSSNQRFHGISPSKAFVMSGSAYLPSSSNRGEKVLRALNSRLPVRPRRRVDVSCSPMKRQWNGQHLTTLMQGAPADAPQPYVRLLKEITPRLRQIVRRQRRFVSAEAIEDLVQDILLSLHAVRASYDPRRPFMPWLMAITRNRLVDGA